MLLRKLLTNTIARVCRVTEAEKSSPTSNFDA